VGLSIWLICAITAVLVPKRITALLAANGWLTLKQRRIYAIIAVLVIRKINALNVRNTFFDFHKIKLKIDRSFGRII
jgi:hypothetical protein